MATPTEIQSVTVALRSGVSEATLPNNVKMKSGKNYVISLEDWSKLSRRARETVVAAPTFNTATYIVPGYTATNASTDRTAVSYLLDLSTINNKTTLANINADAQAPKTFALGDVLYGFKDAAFKLVKVDAGSSAVTAGSVVCWGGDVTGLTAQKALKAASTVTADISDITDDGAIPEFAGVAIGTITAGSLGWIQIAGVAYATQVDATVDAGGHVAPSATDSKAVGAENEIQTITLSGGAQNDTVKFTFNGHEGSALTFPLGGYANTTAAQVKTALLSISDWTTKTADIAVVKTNNDYAVTFSGTLGSQDIGAITVTSATGAGAGSVVETNKGAGGVTGAAVFGTALTAADTGTANVSIRNNRVRNLRSRERDIFRNTRA